MTSNMQILHGLSVELLKKTQKNIEQNKLIKTTKKSEFNMDPLFLKNYISYEINTMIIVSLMLAF